MSANVERKHESIWIYWQRESWSNKNESLDKHAGEGGTTCDGSKSCLTRSFGPSFTHSLPLSPFTYTFPNFCQIHSPRHQIAHHQPCFSKQWHVWSMNIWPLLVVFDQVLSVIYPLFTLNLYTKPVNYFKLAYQINYLLFKFLLFEPEPDSNRFIKPELDYLQFDYIIKN